MLMSRMATSGFSFIVFSTATRPFAAWPTTLQPGWEWRTPRAPRLTNSWSSAIIMRSFFTFVRLREVLSRVRLCRDWWDRYPAARRSTSLAPHTWNADTKLEPAFLHPTRYTDRWSLTKVANFQREF